MIKHFSEYHPQSRVWIYQSNRIFDTNEAKQVLDTANTFAKQWAAHGHPLAAGAELIHNRFLIFCVNAAHQSASGCSIDSSVHFVQQLGQNHKVDFFDRMNIAYINKNQQVDTVHFNKIKNWFEEQLIDENTPIFNNTVTTLEELWNRWQQPLGESWLKNKIPTPS